MLNKELYRYLKSYSTDPVVVDRLITSALLYSNEIFEVKNKLVKNLLIVSTDNDYNNLTEFLTLQPYFSLEDLIEMFEFVISPAERIVTGAVYTPKFVREKIVGDIFNGTHDIAGVKICDPSVGCGGFLLTAAQILKDKFSLTCQQIISEILFGVDIQEFSVDRSKILLSLWAILKHEDQEFFAFHIYVGNSLNFNWNEYLQVFNGFHLIIGNPPYIASRNMSEETKSLLSDYSVCDSGHPDLYIPFFQLGINWLCEGGKLGYITMNTFFKSVNGRSLRSYFEEQSITLRIIDFGANQVFKSKSTYTCICIINKAPSTFISYKKLNDLDLLDSTLTYTQISFDDLDAHEGWNLANVEILAKIESTGQQLSKRYKSRNGIATLKNDVYIFDVLEEDEYFYTMMSEKVYKIEKEICRDIINPNKLNGVRTVEDLKRKIIFPYLHENGKPKVIDEKTLRTRYPKAYKYLKTKKNLLATRDKGNGKYPFWYAFGRNQSLELLKYKLFVPHIASTCPEFLINSDENLYFYNGLAIIGQSESDLMILSKVLSSSVFWFYIVNSSRNYGSNYFSLSKNYFKNFGLYPFDEHDIEFLMVNNDREIINKFIEEKYDVQLNGIMIEANPISS